MTARPQGRVLGGILLVAGSCIGAAMLGLPILTGSIGFVPSCILLFLTWIFMACTGLLLLEVSLWMGRRVSLVTMAAETLGFFGKMLTVLLFQLLFYSILVAYSAGSGVLFSDILHDLCGIHLDPTWASAYCTGFFGLLIYLGVSAVDGVNRILMLGLAGTYIVLLYFGGKHVDGVNLARVEWNGSLAVLPAMAISFGFHNLIPSLTHYLDFDSARLRKVVWMGSSIPLILYVLWEWLLLGLIPWDAAMAMGGSENELATQVLRRAIGASRVVDVAQGFAFFAIATSFLGVALSLRDFLADWMHLGQAASNRALLTLVVLVPPFLCAFTFPGIFLMALSYAGMIVGILFGIIPVWMAWRGRYVLGYEGPQMLPGGRPVLIALLGLSLLVMSAVFV